MTARRQVSAPGPGGRGGRGFLHRCAVGTVALTLASFLSQLLNGLAGASALFLVAAGLTLIFGVTRVVNFAHGSLYMLGAYVGWTCVEWWGRGPLGFWGAVVVATFAVALIGALIEVLLLKRLYAAPELLQLAATFGVVLIVRDAALALWGAEDLLGPRAPGIGRRRSTSWVARCRRTTCSCWSSVHWCWPRCGCCCGGRGSAC